MYGWVLEDLSVGLFLGRLPEIERLTNLLIIIGGNIFVDYQLRSPEGSGGSPGTGGTGTTTLSSPSMTTTLRRDSSLIVCLRFMTLTMISGVW